MYHPAHITKAAKTITEREIEGLESLGGNHLDREDAGSEIFYALEGRCIVDAIDLLEDLWALVEKSLGNISQTGQQDIRDGFFRAAHGEI